MYKFYWQPSFWTIFSHFYFEEVLQDPSIFVCRRERGREWLNGGVSVTEESEKEDAYFCVGGILQKETREEKFFFFCRCLKHQASIWFEPPNIVVSSISHFLKDKPLDQIWIKLNLSKEIYFLR